jgi:CRISPR-associated endonuclease/helicase Cas3
MKYKARYKTGSITEYQPLTTHLDECAMFAELFAKKIRLPKPAFLIALVHDLGKNCKTWANYLDDKHLKGKKGGKEDHGTAGGQYLYDIITKDPKSGNELIAQLLVACVMYHHGKGLPDVIEPDGTPQLLNRLAISKEKTHVDEAVANLDASIKQRLDAILTDENFISETMEILDKLTKSETKGAQCFKLGLTARFLSSCLIDGDRRSSALFDKGIPVREEDAVAKADWKGLSERLEKRLAEFPAEGKLNEIRRMVSERCVEFAELEDGIYTLTAATGAGKTLASLRYALAHAESTGKDHIFIIAPYTSILDQNADVIRGILDPNGKNGQIVLEHHSNLERTEKTEHFIDSSQTWNVPIIITTMVQFLEALFGYGTRKIRRMHQLANSVVIFDEVQTLPISCTYLFNWAIWYLYQNANVSILLCTATQPGLDKLDPEYALQLSADSEIIPDVRRHFEDLRRVELVDETRKKGWTLDEVADFIEKLNEKSILTVVNTKPQARKLYIALSKKYPDWHVVHLSANMCPAHRRSEISQLKEHLNNKTKKCVCISTRLIEAGVDIDFDGAIRFLAGFDSIIQTAGRCNRNGKLKDPQGNPINGKTWIVNIVKEEEKIGTLPDLIRGQKIMREDILCEFHEDEEKFNHNLLHPELITRYFQYYYMQIPDSFLKYKVNGRDETILDLLSDNPKSKEEYKLGTGKKNNGKAKPLTKFRQSFESAWKQFEVISQDTVGVIVPFEKGDVIIKEFFGLPDFHRCMELLQEAQQYSINVYYNEIPFMLEKGIIKKVPLENDLEIYTVEEQHYDQNIGLSDEEGKLTPRIM